jgi:hypothetical protein
MEERLFLFLTFLHFYLSWENIHLSIHVYTTFVVMGVFMMLEHKHGNGHEIVHFLLRVCGFDRVMSWKVVCWNEHDKRVGTRRVSDSLLIDTRYSNFSFHLYAGCFFYERKIIICPGGWGNFSHSRLGEKIWKGVRENSELLKNKKEG